LKDKNKNFSVKMRASKDGEHISGAEEIVESDRVKELSQQLLVRALSHPNGASAEINIKVEEIKTKIDKVSALPVTTLTVDSAEQGWLEVKRQLSNIFAKLESRPASNIDNIIATLKNTGKMRGAIIYDIRQNKCITPDPIRGVRVSCVGADNARSYANKNHFAEALTLASKTANAKVIVGEICFSDDVDYVTGYVASKYFGYVRITKLKEVGEKRGGRIYLYDGSKDNIKKCIDYLENTPVIVTGVPESPIIESKTDKLTKAIAQKKETNIWRNIRVRNNSTSFDGVSTVIMASNDYLGLSTHPQVVAVSANAVKEYGVGAGASRLVTGTLPPHIDFESAIAKFKGTESAMLFGSGYAANTGVIPAIASLGGVILSDELNHASIIDGCKLSKAETIVYCHDDMTDLENKAKQYKWQGGLIVSDAVFSMDGDVANLPKLLEIADKYGYFLMIDEAHSTGVLGSTGRGIAEHYGCRNPDIIMGTCGKALGTEGGFVCGSKELIEYLTNSVRSFIFSTAIAPSQAVAAGKALDIIKSQPERIERLKQNIALFCKEFNMPISQTPIIPIIIGDEKKAVEVSDKLLKAGYYIPAIRYPTVAKGTARLRVALSSEHTMEQIIGAAKAIKELNK